VRHSPKSSRHDPHYEVKKPDAYDDYNHHADDASDYRIHRYLIDCPKDKASNNEHYDYLKQGCREHGNLRKNDSKRKPKVSVKAEPPRYAPFSPKRIIDQEVWVNWPVVHPAVEFVEDQTSIRRLRHAGDHSHRHRLRITSARRPGS